MSADKLVFVVEYHQLVSNTIEKLFMIASRQIGPTYRTTKQNVAHQDEFISVVDEHDMTWRMPGAVENIEFQFTDF